MNARKGRRETKLSLPATRVGWRFLLAQVVVICVLAEGLRAMAGGFGCLSAWRDTCQWRATWQTWCPDDYCPKPWCFGPYRQPPSYICVPQAEIGYPQRNSAPHPPVPEVPPLAPLQPTSSVRMR